jgi:type IV pilus assembly protein PilC
MNFVFTALSPRGERIQDTLECASELEARLALTERGLFVTNLARQKVRRRRARGNGLALRLLGDRNREVAMFTRQMAMLLHAGSPIVPAVRAVIEQRHRADWRKVLVAIADDVENGAALHEALAKHPRYFSGMIRGIIAAGESTATLDQSFSRLTAMLEMQARTRRVVIGALIYPAMLICMSCAVVATLVTFVLPRFTDLFAMLDTELPPLTRWMLAGADLIKEWWIAAAAVPLVGVTLIVLAMRSRLCRQFAGRVLLRLPVVGKAAASVLLAKFLRTWGGLLKSNVPLLEAIRHTRGLSANPDFTQLVSRLAEAVTSGRELSSVLKTSSLVPSTVTAAVATGEKSGRLGESMESVAAWMEEQNESQIQTLTRMIEPAILIVLGVIVGGVCISLFLPLFEIATAA